MTAEIIVVGAGSAGLAAAVTAAREGARVILLERHGFAGGMGTASLVHTFCGLYRMGDGPPVFANPGFPVEIAERMARLTGASGPVKMGRVWVLRQHPVDFARIADELLRESGVEVLFHTEVLDVRRHDDGWGMTTICRGIRREVSSKVLIDTSGDAVVAEMLGVAAERTSSGRLQRPAYVFGVQGVGAGEEGLVLAGRIVSGVRRGILPADALGLHFRASGRPREIFGTIDLAGAEESGDYDPLDVACLSRLEQVGRSVAAKSVDFLRKEALGWQDSYISQWPVRAGVRESRRWKGRHELTEAEVLQGVRHPGDIALAAWPLEFRETNRGPKLRYPEMDRATGIPLGCLQPETLDKILVAGRCISCDHGAQASVRVMGTCFATGQAAGIAAALAANGEAVEGTARRLVERFGPWE